MQNLLKSAHEAESAAIFAWDRAREALESYIRASDEDYERALVIETAAFRAVLAARDYVHQLATAR